MGVTVNHSSDDTPRVDRQHLSVVAEQKKGQAAEYFPSFSWQAKAVSLFMRTFVKPVVSRVRVTTRVMKFCQLGFDTITLALPVNPEVHISPAHPGGVGGEWLSAGRNIVSGRVLLYFHGGGYFFGSPRSHRSLTWRLSRECRAKVLALDYRQPPDWKYPAPLDDAIAAYKSILKRGYKPENIILGGDSAGGNLTLVTMLKLRQLELPLPGAAVLISPWTDLSCQGESIVSNAETDQYIPVNILRFVAQAYSKHSNEVDPFISPVYADLTGFPPLFIQVSGAELLYDDATRIAVNAKAAGVTCRLQVWDKMMHVFQALAGWLPEANLAVKEIGQFVNETLGGDDKPKRRRRARLLSPV
jgi:acetyl esterase/lipase